MKYKRILLKLSGEALMGKEQYGIDPKKLTNYSNEIHDRKGSNGNKNHHGLSRRDVSWWIK